jgi:hypothetical protein
VTEQDVIALLQLLGERDSVSMPRIARQLKLSTSELLRLCAQLGSDEAVGGPGLVEVIEGTPTVVRLTQMGRNWLVANATVQ